MQSGQATDANNDNKAATSDSTTVTPSSDIQNPEPPASKKADDNLGSSDDDNEGQEFKQTLQPEGITTLPAPNKQQIEAVLTRISNSLKRLSEATPIPEAKEIDAFCATRPPEVTIYDYLYRFFNYTGTGRWQAGSKEKELSSHDYFEELLALSIYYLDLYITNVKKVNPLNIHRLLLTSFYIASQQRERTEDYGSGGNKPPIVYFAKIGGITAKELSNLQKTFLKAIRFKLPTPEELAPYYEELYKGLLEVKLPTRPAAQPPDVPPAKDFQLIGDDEEHQQRLRKADEKRSIKFFAGPISPDAEDSPPPAAVHQQTPPQNPVQSSKQNSAKNAGLPDAPSTQTYHPSSYSFRAFGHTVGRPPLPRPNTTHQPAILVNNKVPS